MERALYIKHYRNIGFDSKTNSYEKFILNKSLKKGEIGNLVIVIGANNSGKSNVLNALYNLGNDKIEKRDITTLYYDTKYHKPQLSFVNKDNDDEFTYTLTYLEATHSSYPKKYLEYNLTNSELIDLGIELRNFKEAITFIANLYSNEELGTFANKCDEIINVLSNKNADIKQVITLITTTMNAFCDKRRTSTNFIYAWNKFIEKNKQGFLYLNFNKIPTKKDIINNIYSSNYGMPFIPKIISYKEEQITNSMLNCHIDNIKSNKFYINLLKKLGISINKIKMAYSAFRTQQNNMAVLKDLENELNNEIDNSITKDFNSLYLGSNAEYKFNISLESNMLYFFISKGGKPLSLEYQSTGFRWFFNLYFNLLCKTSLQNGDIIIMDEPAINLHIKGQIELRKFLKKFAIEKGLTIVLATHSPFLIDLDYLDELRIVSNENNISHIYNDFSSINVNEPDSLKPIKEALTINNNILYNPDNKVVFVEGIDMYNYLITFRNKLNLPANIIFLPVEGMQELELASAKSKLINISKELINIKKQNPILLVNGNDIGKLMAEINKEDSNLTVVTLSDINKDFTTISTLFSSSDITNFNLANSKNSQNIIDSAVVKTYASNYDFDSTTIANFKQVFDYIETL